MKRKWIFLLCIAMICNVYGNISVMAEEINIVMEEELILKEIPYLFKITDPDYPVHASASYESDFVGTIQVEGVFTIVEEAEDEEGDLWGKLKSGMGWVNLTDTGMLEETPIQAKFVTEDELANLENHHEFKAEESEYVSWILFETDEELKDVQLKLLQYEYTEETYGSEKILYELSEFTSEKSLLAGVVYWGDMTTYGISFIDGEEKEHHYALYMSGKDGSLIMEKYTPVLESVQMNQK